MKGLAATLALGASVLVLVSSGCRRDTDRKLEQRVSEHLTSTTDAGGIAVSAEDRIIRLEGVVASEGERMRIEDAVRRIPGVLAIDDNLRVQPTVTTTGAEVPAAPSE